MIDFSLTDEQRQLQETAKKFAEKEIKPIVNEYERRPNPKDCIPHELLQKAWDLGFCHMQIPSEYGGGGNNELDTCIVVEELAAADTGACETIMTNNGFMSCLEMYGTEEQQKKWFGALTASKTPYLLAFAATEPGSGSDSASDNPSEGIRTTAIKKGDHYILNGTKCFISNGGLAKLYFVFAKTDPALGAMSGLSCFVVPSDSPGFSIGKIEDKMGHRLSQQAELIFEDVKVPAENIIGGEGMGVPVMAGFLTHGGSGIGAISVGLARAAYEAAREYADQRIQGGMPIRFHQAIGHKLVNMKMKIEAARALVYRVAWENIYVGPNNEYAVYAKVYCSEMAMEVCTEAVQIFGGYGYMRDYPVERFFRDAKLLSIYDGANDSLRSATMLFI